MGGAKVIRSEFGGYTKGNEKGFHTIEAIGMTGGDWRICDEIRVYQAGFEFTQSGQVHAKSELLKTLSGECH